MGIKVGFTGTQEGMTQEQFDAFSEVITAMWHNTGIDEFHQGHCIGADAQAYGFMMTEECKQIGHPPVDGRKIAQIFVQEPPGEERPPKPYLERNHDIVDETDILIACPKGIAEELRSGTWATVRYARKTGKPVVIIYPNGECEG